jgi:hypothetical protein
MSAEGLVGWFRRFLLLLACLMCVGIVSELWLTNHLQTAIQLIPFGLCGLGLLSLGAVLVRPQWGTIWALRVVMLVVLLGGALGVYEHLAGNLAFAQEVNAAAASTAPLRVAITGANPPLAPGALAVTAIVALAATYWHPALAG